LNAKSLVSTKGEKLRLNDSGAKPYEAFVDGGGKERGLNAGESRGTVPIMIVSTVSYLLTASHTTRGKSARVSKQCTKAAANDANERKNLDSP
jgi:hypothetical protein